MPCRHLPVTFLCHNENMSRRLCLLLLLPLAACAPKVSPQASKQTLRAGDLEITVTAPRWVTRQELYPLSVTYTNKGQQRVEFSDPFHCPMIWGVEEAQSGKVPEPKGQTQYGCTTDMPEMKILAPGESYAGGLRGIISKYPAGEYRISPGPLNTLRPLNYRAGKVRKGNGPTLTPQLQPIRFQIR